MQRQYKAYLNDVLESIEKIEEYVTGMSFEEFSEKKLVQDAVVRNLEIIGEAIKKIPKETRNKKPSIDWKKIAGLRDILIHAYFEIDLEIVWDIVENKIPELKNNISELLSEIK